ncbi:hypothetical protein SBFV3_gp44 [Sulfolobales Beppu filamentous virus 3]|uniref:Uncharacterized protein n=1 Tax=Sulfolobales Beppu filamentous virus 3 TaxID=2493124 RepID=A0A3S8NF03_9VIRU|nr:hypothetical protein HOU83_gp44 [Sulfolobales Beppu filamentous virus 3]AZI75879.1 hypothetical protein SBFV3_gp44 [Sulfolobales Beppu filamentous virus 3]
MLKLDFDFSTLSDWDNFYRFTKAVLELSSYAGVKVTVKETAKGYHIYADLDIDPKKAIPLRYYYFDDDYRIAYDEERVDQVPYLTDVLYQEKLVVTLSITAKRNSIRRRKSIKEHYIEREVNPLSVIEANSI